MPHLPVYVGCGKQFPRQTLADVEVVVQGMACQLQVKVGIFVDDVAIVQVSHKSSAVERLPLGITFNLQTTIAHDVAVGAVANVIQRIDHGANGIVTELVLRNNL